MATQVHTDVHVIPSGKVPSDFATEATANKSEILQNKKSIDL